jgi:murein DD-endopeptidase MepM/ murein hydrolase activator NlpD
MAGLPLVGFTPALHDATLGRVDTLRRQLASQAAPGEQSRLREQLAEFASVLVYQMLQAMRRTVPRSELLSSGFAHDLYLSLLDQEVARQVARRDAMGLVSLLQQQFERTQEGAPSPTQSRRALDAYRRHLPQATNPFTLPVDGALSSGFGWRHDPFDHQEQWHNGVDIAAPTGAMVRAAAPGRVVFSGTQPGYGNLLILEHQDGYQTYYGHNDEHLVTVGAAVQRNQPIAHVGQTGRTTGTHVHFEVRQHGRAVDPMPLLNAQRPPHKK